MAQKERKDLKFLVVDDALDIRKIIKAVCRSMGVGEIIEATDGRNAIEQLKHKQVTAKKGTRKNFDLIICDWMKAKPY